MSARYDGSLRRAQVLCAAVWTASVVHLAVAAWRQGAESAPEVANWALVAIAYVLPAAVGWRHLRGDAPPEAVHLAATLIVATALLGAASLRLVAACAAR